MIAKDTGPEGLGSEASTSEIHPYPRRCSSSNSGGSQARCAVNFAKQSEKLSHQRPEDGNADDVAIEARFVTPQDPVIVTAEGHRLPPVPLPEAHKLNMLKEELRHGEGDHLLEGAQSSDNTLEEDQQGEPSSRDITDVVQQLSPNGSGRPLQKSAEGSLRRAMPPSHTHPLFPQLPLYGPPSILRDLQCYTFRITSFFLSLAFLAVIVLGALFTSIIPAFFCSLWMRCTLRNPDAGRPFYTEELRRRAKRKELDKHWKQRQSHVRDPADSEAEAADDEDGFIPTEGGPDLLKCDVQYYARRVGLDIEEFEVQTEDGFLIKLWHVFDPREYTETTPEERTDRGPDLFIGARKKLKDPSQPRKFPVLLMHGLLQSAGAYCTNDDDSLAFFLCKSGYDVWLGNNRCGFHPKHVLLSYSDPRMWCWNIRQMGVFDLPALVSRVLYETGFEKIGLICHSQGTTQSFVSLAKEQRPDLGEKLTVFCALAPAAYAGPLIGKMYFKFMRVITPAMFRFMFGIHAFIPFMMTMHAWLPPKTYGPLGYAVFSFLFNWTDERWDRGLRSRMFQFAPVYVSSESMRWWLGRECFARHKCILSTKEEWHAEEREDHEAEQHAITNGSSIASVSTGPQRPAEAVMAKAAEKTGDPAPSSEHAAHIHRHRPKGSTAWYNEQVPPMALWVCGQDALVDGEKLLKRFERGREPHVKIVHSKVIPNYEHLDVIWAMDAVDQVFKEVREVLWKTCDTRGQCRVPKGCEDVLRWKPEGEMVEELQEEVGEEGESESTSETDFEDPSSAE